MTAVAIKLEEAGLSDTSGRVTAIADGTFEVHTSEGIFRSTRAVSCLVAPETGDLVLLGGPPSTCPYILAVLERPGSPHARISTDGDVTLELRSGRFIVAATEGVDLVSRKAVSVAADRIDVRAREGSLFLASVKLIAGVVDSALERLSQTVKRVYRTVTELDHLRAGQIDYASEHNLRLHGENTLLTARGLLKEDANQIHLG